MNNSEKVIFSFLFAFFIMAGSVFAQANSAIADSIDQQFDRMLKSSNNFQDYKVIKLYKISDLRTATLREINQLSEKIEVLNDKNEQQAENLTSLDQELEQTNAQLQKAEKSKDEFSWLGMQIHKDTYQSIVYGIIALLVLVLLFLVFQYRTNKKETVIAKKNLEQMEGEFEDYRKKALETQQKLGRQLQDERMKNSNRDSGGK